MIMNDMVMTDYGMGRIVAFHETHRKPSVTVKITEFEHKGSEFRLMERDIDVVYNRR